MIDSYIIPMETGTNHSAVEDVETGDKVERRTTRSRTKEIPGYLEWEKVDITYCNVALFVLMHCITVNNFQSFQDNFLSSWVEPILISR